MEKQEKTIRKGEPLNNESESAESTLRDRKPYQKPTFRFERAFETRALSCGKLGIQGQCHGNSSAS
jgi:hypothetical protein